MSYDSDNQEKDKSREERNARRRRIRLDRHTGLDWIDPENGYGKVRGEQALWRAVIMQMLEDAATGSMKSHDQYNKVIARNWLTSDSDDFYMVCDLAGFDVGYLRTNVKKALLNNCKWRKESKPKVKRHMAKGEGKANDTLIIPLHVFRRKSQGAGHAL